MPARDETGGLPHMLIAEKHTGRTLSRVKAYSHERRRRVTQQQTRSPGKWPPRMALGAALAVRLGIAVKPEEYSWLQMIGAGALAGIGFTISLSIAHKAFSEETDFAAAKVGIFLASLIAGGLGTVLLWRAAKAELGKNDRVAPTSTAFRK